MWSWGRGGTRSGQGCVLVRIERRDREGRCGTKRDHATGTSAEKATRGGGRTPPTVANLGGPGFTTDEIRRVVVTGMQWVRVWDAPWGPECALTRTPRSLRAPHPYVTQDARRKPSSALERRALSRRCGCGNLRFIGPSLFDGGPDPGVAPPRVPSGTRDRTTPNPARTLSLGTVSAP